MGKSTLLDYTLAESGGSYLFYRATRRVLPLQLEALTEAAREAYPEGFIPQAFGSFSVFLQFLAHTSNELTKKDSPGPVAVVIDELPYLVEVDPWLLTTLQHWWDANKHRPNLKLFLSGSYLSFMERKVLDVNRSIDPLTQ